VIRGVKKRVYPWTAGLCQRGLLLLTNDGALANKFDESGISGAKDLCRKDRRCSSGEVDRESYRGGVSIQTEMAGACGPRRRAFA